MASLDTLPAPEPGGKMYEKQTIRKIGQATQDPYLKQRMKADDSKAVNMTDSTLGGGIRRTGSD